MTTRAKVARRVILESPFGSKVAADVERNIRYGRAAMRDSLLRGEAPFPSHLLYTQPGVLEDGIPSERAMGIAAGLSWGPVAQASVVYYDLGVSAGMILGIERATKEGRPVERRQLRGRSRCLCSKFLGASGCKRCQLFLCMRCFTVVDWSEGGTDDEFCAACWRGTADV